MGSAPSYDILPYALYDSNVGAMYGLFGAGNNLLNRDEAITVFANYDEKGGRKTLASASFPGRDQRYRTVYSLAVDFDGWVEREVGYNYFGFGSGTINIKPTSYNNELGDFKLTLSRAVTPKLVLESGLRYAYDNFSDISQGDYPLTQALLDLPNRYYILSLALKYTNKDHYTNPSAGEDIALGFDRALPGAGGEADFARLNFELIKFGTPFRADQVLAARVALSGITGPAIPLYEYATLGGRSTLRGYPWYRYRGNASALLNLEYRFPLFWQIGGVLFLDSGKVFTNSESVSLNNIAYNWGMGLRLYLSALILRLDYGRGSEGGKVYLFYNHIF